MGRGKKKQKLRNKLQHKDRVTEKQVRDAVIRYQGKGGRAGGNGKVDKKK